MASLSSDPAPASSPRFHTARPPASSTTTAKRAGGENLFDLCRIFVDRRLRAAIVEHVFVQRVTAGEVKSHENALVRLCREFDPVSIPLSEAVTVYDSLAHMEKLIAGAKLRLAARVEESNE